MGKPGSCPAAMVLKPHQVAVVGCCWCECVFVCMCVYGERRGGGGAGFVPGSQKLYLLLFARQLHLF